MLLSIECPSTLSMEHLHCMPDKRGGLSKEGSGRVAMHKAMGHNITNSYYMLECNHNNGQLSSALTPVTLDNS